jgi:hypothetical protein
VSSLDGISTIYHAEERETKRTGGEREDSFCLWVFIDDM